MIPLASPRTCLLVALGIALAVVLALMVTAPARTLVELDVPTGTTWHSGPGDDVEVRP